nr:MULTISPECIES: tyrosine-type recombinase/integrase [unclassified Caballeronia]
MLARLVERTPSFTGDERAQLARVSAHAFRHTFATQALAQDVPLEVVQQVMGHASLHTTTIYVQAEKQRMIETVAAYYARLGKG